MIQLAVLADDLTGGLIVASSLEAEGVRCPVATSLEALADLPADAEAVVLARKIRLVDPDLARREARAAALAFKRLKARRTFFKYSGAFDSTPRGNIGPIADELLTVLGARRTIFCPAYIERDITVYEGRLFFRNTLLADSIKRFDPVTPAFDSNLVEVLKLQSNRAVGLLPHRILARGRAAVEAELKRLEETPFLIADAADAEDIDRLAALTLDWPLTTGADSLPPALARAWRISPPAQRPSRLLAPAPGYEVVLAGSCSPPTLAQLAAFADRHPVWRIDLAQDGDEPGLAQRIATWATERLGLGPLAIATSGDSAAVAAAQARFGLDGAAERSDRLLGEIAQRLHGAGVRKFVVAGGETSGQVIAALGIGQVRVAPLDDMMGGYCHQDGAAPVSLVLKPGSFGEPDFFFKALDRLREADAAGIRESEKQS